MTYLESPKVKAECEHPLARLNDHRCPSCGGTMRRCCASIVGFEHAGGCWAVQAHRKAAES